jgi:endo-1,4-beta-xylanase
MTSGRSLLICASALAVLGGACSGASPGISTESGKGGTSSGGGAAGSGGQPGSGGRTGAGGSSTTGGTVGSGGQNATGGATRNGGAPGSGGVVTSGGASGSGGQTTGSGGNSATGGSVGRDAGRDVLSGSGGQGKGGSPGTGGSGAGGSTVDSGTIDINCDATMPTGGQSHSGNGQAGSGNLAWQLWSNQGTGTLTTFSTPAFSASWNNSGNYLGRLGFEFGNAGKSFDTYGTITAQFTETKSGNSGNQWSYIGVYGWTTNPCIEWYIIDDSYSKMPINPGNCTNMPNSPLSIDDGKYTMCVRTTSGTGGDRCGGLSSWTQYYSIRQSNRTCGTISVSEHFKAWTANSSNKMGNLLEVKVLLEVGGGQGSVDFPIANVTKTQ